MIVTSGGIGANHDLVRQSWPKRLGEPPNHMLSGVPDHVDGRMLGIVAKRRRQHHQPGPHVALHGGHHQLRADLERARHPHPAGSVVAVDRRDGQAPAGAAVPGLRYARHAGAPAHHGPRLFLVRADAEDHRARIRAVGLGAEPRPHGQEHPEGARPPLRRAGTRRCLQEAGRGFHRQKDAAGAGGRHERARRRRADRCASRWSARSSRATGRSRTPTPRMRRSRPSAARATTWATS